MVGKIKALCKSRGITLNALERESGVAVGTVGRWDENRPSVDKVKLVADYLGVTVDELLKSSDS